MARYVLCLVVFVIMACASCPAAHSVQNQLPTFVGAAPSAIQPSTQPPQEDTALGNRPPSPAEKRPSTGIPAHTFRELALSYAVLVFGLVIVLVEHLMLRKRPEDVTPENLLLLNAVTLIVIGTLFLVTSGFKDQQIAPAMGLFGTIVGYLLGRKSRTRSEEKSLPAATNTTVGGGEQ